jgi:hypothetical protein
LFSLAELNILYYLLEYHEYDFFEKMNVLDVIKCVCFFAKRVNKAMVPIIWIQTMFLLPLVQNSEALEEGLYPYGGQNQHFVIINYKHAFIDANLPVTNALEVYFKQTR